ncbi:MAG: hypothetical protein U0U67_15245 [Chitinophagales bacterium]
MKYLFYFLFFTGSILKMNAQDESKTFIQKKDEETAYLRSTEIIINSQTFDYRILKHYTETQLRSLPSAKLKQVHFIYTQSYSVQDLQSCPDMSYKDIDVAKLERFRLDDATITVEYGTDCKVKVTLMSKSQLQLFLNQITE